MQRPVRLLISDDQVRRLILVRALQSKKQQRSLTINETAELVFRRGLEAMERENKG
jgi:predicted ATPase